MKIAILMSGSPRYSSDLDIFIDKLKGYDTADWYCHTWQDNPMPDKLGYDNYILVAPTWRHVDKQWAWDKISSNLPVNHTLKGFEVLENEKISFPTIPGQRIHFDNEPSIYKMHLGWKLVDAMRQASGLEYDLVIRARPDISLTESLDLQGIKNIIDTTPNVVVTPNGGQHGYGYTSNDLLAISSPANMAKYADLVTHTIDYNRQGIIYHPETLLGYHLQQQGIKNLPMVRAEIRKNFTEVNGIFTVDFGRWG